MPLLSAIIPTYNYGIFLKDAVTSVLNQTVSDLELIVVDDGSTDKTTEVIDSIKDRRIHYHFQGNQGLAQARNTGIRLSSGKYLAFLDADDTWLPQKSAWQFQLFEQNPGAGLVYGSYRVVDIKGESLAVRNAEIVKANWLEKLVCGNYVAGSASTSMVRRDVFVKAGLFDPNLAACEDWDLWLRIARWYEIVGLNRVVSCIRLHEKNMTAHTRVMDQGFEDVLDKFFTQPDLPVHLHKLQKKSRSKAKIAAGVMAARRGDYRFAINLSCQAIRFYPWLLDAYYLLFRSVFHRTI